MNHPPPQPYFFTPTHRLNQPRINFPKKNRGSLREPDIEKDLLEDQLNYGHQPVYTDPNADNKFSEMQRDISHHHHKPKAPVFRMLSIKNVSNAPQLVKFFQVKQEISIEIPDKKDSIEPSLNKLDNESPFSPIVKRIDSARKRTISLGLTSPKSKKDLHVIPKEGEDMPPANMFNDEALFQETNKREKRRQTIKRILVNDFAPESLPKLSPKYEPPVDSIVSYLKRKIQPWAILAEAAEKLEKEKERERSNENFKAFYQPDISNLRLEKNKPATKSQNSLEPVVLPTIRADAKASYRSEIEQQISSQINSPKVQSPTPKEKKIKKQGEAKSRDESPIKYWEGFETLSMKLKGLVRGGKSPKKIHVSQKNIVKVGFPITNEIVEKTQKSPVRIPEKGHSKHSLRSLAEEDIMAHLQSLRKSPEVKEPQKPIQDTHQIATILQTKALEPIAQPTYAGHDMRPNFHFEFRRPRILSKDVSPAQSKNTSPVPESLSNSPGKYETSSAAAQEKAFLIPGYVGADESPRKKAERKKKIKLEQTIPSQIIEEPQSFLERKLVDQGAKEDSVQGWHLDTSRDLSRLKTPDNPLI